MACLRTAIALLTILSVAVSLGARKLECEDLSAEECTFSVSSSGERCLLEKYITEVDSSIYQCQTSNIIAEKQGGWIETDECMQSCGLERMSVGISSDGLVQRQFLSKLCSANCQNNCPNIVDLFDKLAAGEGIHLQNVCNYFRPSVHRILADSVVFKNTEFVIESLSAEAAAPESSVADSLTASAFAPAPAQFI